MTKSMIRWSTLGAAAALAACNSDAPKPVPPEPPRTRAAVGGATSGPTADARQALPTDHSPTGTRSAPAPRAVAEASEVRWTAPAGWVAEPPSSAMRQAQYRVPGPGGDGEFLVFYFGPGQGGDAMSNAQRWASQFHTGDGHDGGSAMKTRETTAGGMAVLMVDVAGTYVGGMGGNTPGERPGYGLLGAIAQGPDSNWFFKLTGPEKTVAAQRSAFEGLVRSLKKGA